MTVTILLFARYREAAGTDIAVVELPDGATLGDAWAAVRRRFPGLAAEASPMMALDRAYRGADAGIPPGAEVAFFPPVSGG
jgi:molybdopterin converting factor small subunit